MKEAVVILNYNGQHLLERFLPSVMEYSTSATIYVVDNASTDGSSDFIKNRFPDVKLIHHDTNYGYAEGYNRAIPFIDEELLCLLNSDVQVTENWLALIAEEFSKDEKLAIAQPKILDLQRPDYFEYAGASGGFIDKYAYPYCRGRIFDTIEKDKGQYDDVKDIMWASGACFFIRKKVFEELGGFDRNFFAHMEEIDLCWRAVNQGHIIKALPMSKVYHLGGGTLNYNSSRKVYLNFRNSLYTLYKNAPGNLFSIFLVRLILDKFAAFYFLLKFQPKNCLAVIRAYFGFIGHLSTLKTQRKSISQRKKYYKVKSIVWTYYLRNIKEFRCL